jgi:hypothetical protein
MVEIAILNDSGLNATEIGVYICLFIHTCNSSFSVQGDPLSFQYTFVVSQHFVLYFTFVIDLYIYLTGLRGILSMQMFLSVPVNGWPYLNVIKYFDVRMVR